MRILHISTRLILGGSQENTVLSCEGQVELGHDVHLAFGPIYGPEGSLLDRVRSYRTPDGRGITTHEVKHLEREIRPLTDCRCFVELRRLIERLRPDVVHTHSSKAGIIGRGAAWRALRAGGAGGGGRRPMAIVHTIHGPPFHTYQSRIKNAIYVASERWAARRCHVIVSVADAMTAQFRAHNIGRPGQYVTVYSGMEVDRFLTPRPGETREEMRRHLGFGAGDFVIGTVARLAELKGHDDLLDALADDLKANPRWKLLWVGDGWWRDRLLARVESLGLRERVITTGLVPQDRVPAMMRAMDVLVHPSYREGLPRTVPQALLCGVCPVAHDVDGTGEVCRTNETGMLVPPGDHAELRAAIVKLHEEPDLRARLAAAGREECRARFDHHHMVAELEKVYARALAAN